MRCEGVAQGVGRYAVDGDVGFHREVFEDLAEAAAGEAAGRSARREDKALGGGARGGFRQEGLAHGHVVLERGEGGLPSGVMRSLSPLPRTISTVAPGAGRAESGRSQHSDARRPAP